METIVHSGSTGLWENGAISRGDGFLPLSSATTIEEVDVVDH